MALDIKLLDDATLIRAAQGQVPGVMPIYAIGELDGRNKLRSSAPVQAPQGTVAGNVIQQALNAAGIDTSKPFQPYGQQTANYNMSRNGGLAPSSANNGSGISAGISQPSDTQPQSFSKGGILGGIKHYATGDEVTGQSLSAGQSQVPSYAQPLTANLQNYSGPTDVNYTPGYTPTQDEMSPEGAMRVQQSLYGPSPDYAGQIADIKQNQKQYGTYTPGAGEFLTTLVGNVMSNQTNPIAGFGKGLVQAQENEVQARQKNFANSLASIEQTGKITEDQQRRAQAMAQSSDNFLLANRGIADNNARAQYEAASGNRNEAINIWNDNQRLAQERALNAQNILKLTGTRDTRNAMLANLDPNSPEAKVLNSITATENTQAQADSDRALAERKAEIEAQGAETRRNQAQESGLIESRAQNEFKRQQSASGMTPNGQVDPNSTFEQTAQGLANYTIDPSMQKTRGMSPQMWEALQTRAQQIAKSEGRTWSEGDYKQGQNAINKFSNDKNLANAQTALSHLSLLKQASEAQSKGDINTVNAIRNRLATELGQSGATNFNALAPLIGNEVANSYGHGTVEGIQSITNSIDNNRSPAQIQGFIKTQTQALLEGLKSKREELQATPGVYANNPVVNKARAMGPSKDFAVSLGIDPDNPSNGFAYQGLPGGNGKPSTPDVEQDFVKRAGGNKEDANRMLDNFGYIGRSTDSKPVSNGNKALPNNPNVGIGAGNTGQGATSGVGTVKSPNGNEYPLQ